MAKEVIINLNDKKITAPKDPTKSTAAFVVMNDRTLIINGDGVVDGGSGSYENNAISIEGGNVIINGGTFKSGRNRDDLASCCIYIRKPGGTLYITGGEFFAPKSNVQKSGHDWYPIIHILNSLKKSSYDIKISGGTFYGFDPREGDNKHAESFVADGYTVITDGEYTDFEGNTMPIYKVRVNNYGE